MAFFKCFPKAEGGGGGDSKFVVGTVTPDKIWTPTISFPCPKEPKRCTVFAKGAFDRAIVDGNYGTNGVLLFAYIGDGVSIANFPYSTTQGSWDIRSNVTMEYANGIVTVTSPGKQFTSSVAMIYVAELE